MRIYDYFYLSFKYLLKNKVRTFLTALGIIIGMSIFVGVNVMSYSLEYSIQNQVNSLGQNLIIIIAGQQRGFQITESGKGVNINIINQISKLPGVLYSFPVVELSENVKYNGQSQLLNILGINYPYINALEQYGGFEFFQGNIYENNYQCNAIIGYNVYNDIFNQKVYLGSYININGYNCRVVGILQQTGTERDDEIFIPLTFLQKNIYKNSLPYQDYVIAYNFTLANESINNYLKLFPNQKFIIISSQSILSVINSFLNTIYYFAIAMAIISVIISAINITNTVYMSVIERIKEIGILKAMGLYSKEVLLLFLIESSLYSLIGGIIGDLFGISFGYLLGLIFERFRINFNIYIPTNILLYSIIFSLIVGIISGIIPAYKASKITPIEALRSE